jgi:NarL family two-component system response regulator LiaR
MDEPPIRVLVVDDHAIVRKGICALMDTEVGITVIGEAANGQEAIAQAARLGPDVILLDLVMPEMDGVEAIRRIRAHQIDSRILVLTSFGSDNKLFPAIKAGAVGYLLKDTSPAELIAAIRRAAAGESTLNPTVARRLLREFSADAVDAPPVELLTKRESEVLLQIARGLTNEHIAGQLHISDATVRTHVSNILGKLNLTNRTQAALYALRTGLISIDEISDFSDEQPR